MENEQNCVFMPALSHTNALTLSSGNNTRILYANYREGEQIIYACIWK